MCVGFRQPGQCPLFWQFRPLPPDTEGRDKVNLTHSCRRQRTEGVIASRPGQLLVDIVESGKPSRRGQHGTMREPPGTRPFRRSCFRLSESSATAMRQWTASSRIASKMESGTSSMSAALSKNAGKRHLTSCFDRCRTRQRRCRRGYRVPLRPCRYDWQHGPFHNWHLLPHFILGGRLAG